MAGGIWPPMGVAHKTLKASKANRMSESNNRRQHERIPIKRSVEMTTLEGMQDGEITNISVGGAAIVSRNPLAIELGEPVELRIENFEKIQGRVVRAGSKSNLAIAFDIDECDARQIVDDLINENSTAQAN